MKFTYVFKNGLHVIRAEVAGKVQEFTSRLSLHDAVQLCVIEKARNGEFFA